MARDNLQDRAEIFSSRQYCNSLSKIKKTHYCLRVNRFDDVDTEENFRRIFFALMHVIKAKRKVVLDIVPRNYFVPICDKLLEIAFDNLPLLQVNCRLEDIII